MSAGERPAIRVADVTVTFSRWGQTVRALDGIDLEVPSGQWILLVGHNGSGKSTLLRTISGRVEPAAGTVDLAGRPVAGMSGPEAAREVFYVHQDPMAGTAPALTVFENLFIVDNGARKGVSRAQLRERYAARLQPLGLEDRLRQPAATLSGGERQLLTLLVASLTPARIILLDEPLGALDPGKVQSCLQQIRLLRELGKTIIQVSHDERLATSLGDRTIALRQGRLVYDQPAGSRDLPGLIDHWHRTEPSGAI